MENGSYQFISNPDYHSGPGYSRSDLETIRKHSLSHYHAKKGQADEPTPAQEFGTAFHQLILEPELFYKYNISEESAPVKPKFGRTKLELVAKEEWENRVYNPWLNENEGKKVWKEDLWAKLHDMRVSIYKNTIMKKILEDSETKKEISYYWNENDTLLKCRPDIFYPKMGLIMDLKTAHNCNYTQFRKDLVNFCYDVQAAFYTDLVSKVEATNKVSFVFACIEKDAPYAVALYKLDDASLEVGRELYKKALDKINNPEDNEDYPSFIQEINLAAFGFDVEAR